MGCKVCHVGADEIPSNVSTDKLEQYEQQLIKTLRKRRSQFLDTNSNNISSATGHSPTGWF